jgi:hypothetical protein
VFLLFVFVDLQENASARYALGLVSGFRYYRLMENSGHGTEGQDGASSEGDVAGFGDVGDWLRRQGAGNIPTAEENMERDALNRIAYNRDAHWSQRKLASSGASETDVPEIPEADPPSHF